MGNQVGRGPNSAGSGRQRPGFLRRPGRAHSGLPWKPEQRRTSGNCGSHVATCLFSPGPFPRDFLVWLLPKGAHLPTVESFQWTQPGRKMQPLLLAGHRPSALVTAPGVPSWFSSGSPRPAASHRTPAACTPATVWPPATSSGCPATRSPRSSTSRWR